MVYPHIMLFCKKKGEETIDNYLIDDWSWLKITMININIKTNLKLMMLNDKKTKGDHI